MHVTQVVRFLGLPPANATVLEAMDRVEPSSWAKGKEMLPAARQKLLQFYGPFNNQLQKLVDIGSSPLDFRDWNL